jgi:hypothetical protein
MIKYKIHSSVIAICLSAERIDIRGTCCIDFYLLLTLDTHIILLVFFYLQCVLLYPTSSNCLFSALEIGGWRKILFVVKLLLKLVFHEFYTALHICQILLIYYVRLQNVAIEHLVELNESEYFQWIIVVFGCDFP